MLRAEAHQLLAVEHEVVGVRRLPHLPVDRALDQAALTWLERFHGLDPAELHPATYRYQDAQAVRHVFRVATGLDSLVVGEPQILGQLKQAYRIAQDARTLSGPLEQLLQRSFSVAKTVRTETRLGANAVSVAYAAVRLAGQVFDEMPKRQALLVGAGETIELVARHLLGAGVRRTTVVNRTLERARALADRIGGQAARLADLETHLVDCDILVTATHGNDPVVRSDMVRRAFAGRRRRPLFAVDLGVPVPTMAAALFARFTSQQEDSPSMKMVAAMRNQFGGHAVKRTPLSG